MKNRLAKMLAIQNAIDNIKEKYEINYEGKDTLRTRFPVLGCMKFYNTDILFYLKAVKHICPLCGVLSRHKPITSSARRFRNTIYVNLQCISCNKKHTLKITKKKVEENND